MTIERVQDVHWGLSAFKWLRHCLVCIISQRNITSLDVFKDWKLWSVCNERSVNDFLWIYFERSSKVLNIRYFYAKIFEVPFIISP